MFDTVRLILYGKRLAVKAGSNNGRVEIKAHGNYSPFHADATSQGYLASNLKKIYHPNKNNDIYITIRGKGIPKNDKQ